MDINSAGVHASGRVNPRKLNPTPLSRLQTVFALAILALYLTVAVALAFTNRPQSDEAIYANPGYNLIHTGKMGVSLYELRGYLPLSTAEHTYLQPPLYFVVTAGLYRMIGFGLGQIRFFSIFFGLVCLLSWRSIVLNLTKSQTAGLLVAGLISVDYFFLIGASHGRMDMMCVGLGSAGLAIYMHWREDHFDRAVFWGNLLAGLALLTHPAGMVWAAAVLLAILLFDPRRLSIKTILLTAIPYLLVGAAWGSYIHQDPTGFRDQLNASLAINEGSFDYSHLSHSRFIRYLQQEILTRYAAPFGFLPGVSLASRLKIFVLTAYLVGAIGILAVRKLRRQRFMIWVPACFLIGFLFLAESSPSKFTYYLPHTTVFLAASLGMFLWGIDPGLRSKPALAAVAIIALIQLAGVGFLIRQRQYQRTYAPVIEAIVRHTPPSALIMSEAELWFGLQPERRVLFDYRLGFLSGLHPDAFVMNGVFRDLHERDRKSDPAAFSYEEKMINAAPVVYRDTYSEVYLTQQLNAK